MSIRFMNMYTQDFNNELFVKDDIVKTNSSVVIHKRVDVIGNNFIFEDEVIIASKCSFNYVTFKKSVKIVTNYIEVEFNNCVFEATNKKSAIIIQKVKANVVIDKCTFISFKTAIRISDKASFNISNNTFIDCKVALNGVSECFSNSKNNIINNITLGREDQFFIRGSYFNGQIEEVIESVRELKRLNNNGRITFLKNNEVLIDTLSYFVVDNDTLSLALENIVHGGTIYLNKNKYYGEIEIVKSIEVIGENGAIIEPIKNKTDSSAIFIKANNVQILNLTIQASQENCFRDGITYKDEGGNNCKFANMEISGIRRRGISIWGKNTCNTIIHNCIFENILTGSAISSFGEVIVEDCTFKNCNNGLYIMFDSKNSLLNNEFNKVKYIITGKKDYFNKIKIDGNKYNWTNMLITLL